MARELTGRICKNLNGAWTLHYYVQPSISGYRHFTAASRRAVVRRAKEIGVRRVFLNFETRHTVAIEEVR